ncbi:TetR/AcrR family transcriptional regulator [Arthrobacter sp. CJ23]|uniref:TetR/AcrR family transcriptional regulator n=1 Tax=Arthrobacter sp. CJ23 TaxID=2972479 RepID=UPI00215CE9C7|nr:TetR family transcriptional regulator [Arthrobacter sp. CJ23]UVJ38910.1 TetR family transcriptional regulator [Arthrobacter sp. CJ23]
MTPTKLRALDAAIELLGTAGLRALTHARVDDRAGIPKGSTSNYFRTRAALLSGAVDRIVDREMSEIGPDRPPASASELVEMLCRLLESATTTHRTLTTARLVLFMEASHNPALRETVSRGRVAMESAFIPVLALLGAQDPQTAASAIAASYEGLLLHRIARHDCTDPRPTFELVVRAALS